MAYPASRFGEINKKMETKQKKKNFLVIKSTDCAYFLNLLIL